MSVIVRSFETVGHEFPKLSILMNACCKSTIVIRLLYVFSFIRMINLLYRLAF
jgi:hypothetical protein